MTIRKRLLALRDEKNAAFLARLIPNLPPETVLGARTPELRSLARELRGTEEAACFLETLPHGYLEENQLGDLNWMLALSNAITGIQITAEEYKNKTGNYAEWEEALQSYSPVNFVSPACPPTVIAHGAEDTVVPFSTAQTLEKALTDNGVKHDFVVFPHSGHGLDADPDVYEKTIDLLIQYAAAYLK